MFENKITVHLHSPTHLGRSFQDCSVIQNDFQFRPVGGSCSMRLYLVMAALLLCPGHSLLWGQQRLPALDTEQSGSASGTRIADTNRASSWNRLSTVLPLRPPLGSQQPSNSPEDTTGKSPQIEKSPAAKEQPEKLPTAANSSSESSATGTGEWSLSALEALALQHNPVLQRAAANVKAAHGRALQAGLRPNPETGFSYQQIGSRGLAEQFGATLQQEFVVRDKLNLNREIAVRDIQRLESELAIQHQRVLTDVRVAYVRTLKSQKQLEFLKSLVSLSDQARVISEKLFQAEEVSKTDVLQAEVEVERARVAYANALNRYRATWRELTSVVGQPNLPWNPLTGELKGPSAQRDFDQTLTQLRSASPEVALLAATVQRARSNLRRQQVEPWPNLTVEGLVNWQDNGIGGKADGALTVSLPIPFWDRNQGAIQAAYQELIAADKQLHVLQLDLQQRLAAVDERYRNALQQTTQFEQVILPKAAEVLTLTRKAYEIGELDFVGLLTAQRSYAQFQLDYLDALEELRISEFEMEGLLLSGSLRQTP